MSPPSPDKATEPATPEPAHSPSPTNDKGVVFRHWILEVGLLLLLFGLFAAVVVILAWYHDQPVPEWSLLGFNINAVVALLSTAIRADILIILAAVIGQAKWDWIAEQPRTLAKFQTYDEASRGPLGSLKLLSNTGITYRNAWISILASLGVLLSQGISTFTQQALKTVPCTGIVDGSWSSIPAAHFVPGPNRIQYWGGTGPGPTLDSSTQGLALAAVLGDSNLIDASPIQADCESGNCTWADFNGVSYSTIALCHQCMDVSNLASVTHGPEGTAANVTIEDLWVSDSINDPLISIGRTFLEFASEAMSPSFREVSYRAILNLTLLAITRDGCTESGCPRNISTGADRSSYVAIACTLYACVKDYSARVERGRLLEKVVASTPLHENITDPVHTFYEEVSSNTYPRLYAARSPCFTGSVLYDAQNMTTLIDPETRANGLNLHLPNVQGWIPTDCLYSLSSGYFGAIQRYLDVGLLSGNCLRYRTSPPITCPKLWLSAFYADGKATVLTLEEPIARVTTAFTNLFRVSGYGAVSNYSGYTNLEVPAEQTRHERGAPFATGSVHITTICIKFEWAWLLFPASLCLVTVLVLLGIIRQGYVRHDVPIWKSNLLPLFFYRFTIDNEPHQIATKALLAKEKFLKRKAKLRQAVLYTEEREIEEVNEGDNNETNI